MPSDFFVIGGAIPPDARCYVKRSADDLLFDYALSGKYCHILTPRQMGKSSLRARTALRLRDYGVRVASIDLNSIGGRTDSIGTGPHQVDTWYLDFLSVLARELKLSEDVEGWWRTNALLGQVYRFTKFLRDMVLEEILDRIVIFIDEIDVTLQLSFTDEFFAAIRACYNARVDEPKFDRLTFVFLGTASPGDLIKDPTQTPYNIGQEVELQEFSLADAFVLQGALEHIYPGQGEAIFQRIYYWTNGHPYLTQRLCQVIAQKNDGVWHKQQIDQQVKDLFLLDKDLKELNLVSIKKSLEVEQNRQAILLYGKVLSGRKIKDEKQSRVQNSLKLSGLVKAKDGYLCVRNEIYRRAFSRTWVQENTPVDLTRRTKIAIGTTVSILGILVLMLASFIGYTYWLEKVQLPAHIANFYLKPLPAERLTNLAGMFSLHSPFGVDYGYQARELFYGLSKEEQLGLFSAQGVEEEAVLAVIRGLYGTLADVDETGSSTPLLEAMAATLDRSSQTEDISRLSQEIKYWTSGRKLAGQKQYEQARIDYDNAIRLNGNNPATHYERARVLTQLSEYQHSLEDLDHVIALVQKSTMPTPTPLSCTREAARMATPFAAQTPSPVSTATLPATLDSSGGSSALIETPAPLPTSAPLRITSEFATLGDITNAVYNLINGNPFMIGILQGAPNSDYPNLRRVGLAPTPIGLVTPTPLSLIPASVPQCNEPDPTALAVLSTARQWSSVVLSDTFDIDTGKWRTVPLQGEVSVVTASISNSLYYVDIDGYSPNGVIAWIDAPVAPLGDFYVAADIWKIEGAVDSHGAVTFRRLGKSPQEPEQLYAFRINDNREVIVSRLLTNGATRLCRSVSPLIRSMRNNANRLEIIGQGPHFVLFINGSYVAKFDDTSLPSGKVGIALFVPRKERAVYAFDNFEVRAP